MLLNGFSVRITTRATSCALKLAILRMTTVGFPLNRNRQSAFLIFADYGVHLEITDTLLFIDNGRALFDTNPIRHFLFVHAPLPYFLR